jgi:hypothetical protein
MVTGVGSLTAPFGAPLEPAVGLPLNPGSDLMLRVTFTPTKKGTFITRLKLTWRDVNGGHTLILMLTGTGMRRIAGEHVPED